MTTRVLFYSGIALLAAGATIAVAQRERTDKTSANNNIPTRRRANRTPMAWTPGREAAAYTFAKINHPELADLLDRLKGGRNKRAYQRAIRQLYFDSERLARLKDLDSKSKSSKRYGVALKLWKLDSRIRLLTARVAMSKADDKELQSQLDSALKERIDLRIAQMEVDHARTLERAKKLKQQIENLKQNKEKAAKQHLSKVKRGLGLIRKRARKKNRTRPKQGKKTGTP